MEMLFKSWWILLLVLVSVFVSVLTRPIPQFIRSFTKKSKNITDINLRKDISEQMRNIIFSRLTDSEYDELARKFSIEEKYQLNEFVNWSEISNLSEIDFCVLAKSTRKVCRISCQSSGNCVCRAPKEINENEISTTVLPTTTPRVGFNWIPFDEKSEQNSTEKKILSHPKRRRMRGKKNIQKDNFTIYQ